MYIKRCKQLQVLPSKGTPVRTEARKNLLVEGLSIKRHYKTARKSAAGTYLDFVAGTSGDVWWVEHENGDVAAYTTDEVFDR